MICVKCQCRVPSRFFTTLRGKEGVQGRRVARWGRTGVAGAPQTPVSSDRDEMRLLPNMKAKVPSCASRWVSPSLLCRTRLLAVLGCSPHTSLLVANWYKEQSCLLPTLCSLVQPWPKALSGGLTDLGADPAF